MKTVVKVTLLLVGTLSFGGILSADHHEEPGFISLFDGKTLEGWDGNPKFWSVKDGAITGITTQENPTRGNTFIIWRGGTLDDFELRLKFKIVGGNSGIQYRSEDKGNWVVGGYQGDFEAGTRYSGILYEEKGRGILALRGQKTEITAGKDKHEVTVVGTMGDSAEIQKVIKQEEWNDYKIIARGYEFTHVINGRVTSQVTDLDKSNRTPSGILALQLHAGPPMTVQFKDIRVKPLNGVNVSGHWDFKIETEQGTGEPSFDLEQDGNRVTGKYEGLFGSRPVEGKVEGNKVSLRIVGEYEGQEVFSAYEGTLKGFGSLEGKVNFNDIMEASFSGTKR